jgi:hypothetical protein
MAYEYKPVSRGILRRKVASVVCRKFFNTPLDNFGKIG